MSEIYDGETYDARREQIGWTSPEFDDHEWPPLETIGTATDDLIAPEGSPVRRREDLVPKKIFKTPSGDTVVDFGQNMVGWVRLKVHGRAGTVVTLRHAEVRIRMERM
jgi:alpha-L-rhamnosidase